MAKLVKNKYRRMNGDIAINNYFAPISKVVVEKAGFTGEEQIKVYAKNGKIIIEKGDKNE